MIVPRERLTTHFSNRELGNLFVRQRKWTKVGPLWARICTFPIFVPNFVETLDENREIRGLHLKQ